MWWGSTGVYLDSLNALAVAEEPLAYARRLGSLIRHVHVKDYRLYRTPQGFRLVRCSLGEGVLDVRGLLSVLRESAPGATTALELAALHGRHVRFLEPGYWTGFPPQRVEEVIPVLRMRDALGERSPAAGTRGVRDAPVQGERGVPEQARAVGTQT